MVLGFSRLYPKGSKMGTDTFFREKSKEGIKIHSMREDPRQRWAVGMSMQLSYGVRTKQYECFKDTELKSKQRIEIQYKQGESVPTIICDGRKMGAMEIVMLAINDGFDSVDDFFEWFPENWTGWVLHWTDFTYDGDMARLSETQNRMDRVERLKGCCDYEPKKYPEQSGDCSGDGHKLCKDCIHYEGKWKAVGDGGAGEMPIAGMFHGSEIHLFFNSTASEGTIPGNVCGRDGCDGVLVEGEYIGDGCTCKIDDECQYCQQNPIKCPVCGFHYPQKA